MSNVKDPRQPEESVPTRELDLPDAATQELESLSPGSGASMQQLARLSETLLSMAAGDFEMRAARTYTRDPFDVLAYLVNNTADELESLITRVERQNMQLESILESMADGIILLDADGFIRRTNRSLVSMLKAQEEFALLNLPMTAIVTAESHPTIETFFEADGTEPVRAELAFEIGSATQTFPAVCSAIRSAGQKTGFVVLVQDDRELRRARARAQLSDRMTAMGAMAAGVAHEINNPLAYVAANIDYVMDLFGRGSVEPTAAAEALADALDGVRRVREIVADLNSFSRADDESKSLVPLSHVVRSAVKMLTTDLKHCVSFEMSVPDLPRIEANEARLTQVFVNILLNALHALDSFPRSERSLRIDAHNEGESVVIAITDNGPGISTEDLPRIFDAFFTTKPVGKGTGLGLAISHQTVVNLGGRIDVETELGKGTTFRVVLPIEPQLSLDEPSLHTLSEASEQISSCEILIIDDERPLARALRRRLSALHDVTIETDPEQALELLAHQNFGAILCDVMMPRVSGIDIYRKVKSARPELAERFIFMTGGAFTAPAQKFLDEVDAPCLRKPFDHAELEAHLRRLVGRNQD